MGNKKIVRFVKWLDDGQSSGCKCLNSVYHSDILIVVFYLGEWLISFPSFILSILLSCFSPCQVLWSLSNVNSFIVGDFVGCGSTQCLFVPRPQIRHPPVQDEMDVLALMDVEMETDTSGDLHFLLTDFLSIHVDRWKPGNV